MRVLIVDDEPLAQTALAKILAARKDVDGFDFASDATEALEKLGKNSYDLLLLDINLPEISGLELVDRLKERSQPLPSIIFVTAHNKHAITAFEKHPVDYVLKPFLEERIQEALNIAARRTEGERAAQLISALPNLETFLRKPQKIAIRAKGRILFLDPAEVPVVRADGNYVLLQQSSGSYLARESLSTLEEKLRPYGFIRIHRSVLVNASFVEEVQPCITGEYLLRLRGGTEYTVSRTYKKNLNCIAESWIGIDSFTAG
jgi:DNA-binding LytR/AlgR family response regulator